jgi:hypothetical protein
MVSEEHEKLKSSAKEKLEKLGYKVTSVPSQMKKVFAMKGYTLQDIGNPDLCATKGDEVVLVQAVVTNLTTSQLENYQKMGKVILVFNFPRLKDFEVWGWNNLL